MSWNPNQGQDDQNQGSRYGGGYAPLLPGPPIPIGAQQPNYTTTWLSTARPGYQQPGYQQPGYQDGDRNGYQQPNYQQPGRIPTGDLAPGGDGQYGPSWMNIDPKLAMGLATQGAGHRADFLLVRETESPSALPRHAVYSLLWWSDRSEHHHLFRQWCRSTLSWPIGFRSGHCRLRRLDCPVDQWFPG